MIDFKNYGSKTDLSVFLSDSKFTFFNLGWSFETFDPLPHLTELIDKYQIKMKSIY